MSTTLLILVGASVIFWGFKNAEDPRITKILSQIGLFTQRSNLQKVYVKTDKDKYVTGETIWLNAFLVNAVTLNQEKTSNEIFVDLLDHNNVVRESIILRNTDGYAKGDIVLSDSLPDGNYLLVAYSNWMKNFDEAYFFSKTIQIVSPGFQKYLTQRELTEIKNKTKDYYKSESDKVIQFFPEGGNLVYGLQCRVAFKAANKLGLGVPVTGEIYDDTGNRISRFEAKHAGMGSFLFTPEAGRKYYSKVTFGTNEAAKFELPVPIVNGYSLMVNANAGDQIRINIQSNNGNQADEKDNDIIILGQSRGEVKYMSKAVYKGKPINLNIPKKSFPAGIAQITLFNGKGEPACERLVFIHPKEVASLTKMEVNKTENSNDIVYAINLKKADGSPSGGNLSFSVSENLDQKFSWRENILSNILLTSDLKGRVENAYEYFDESNPEAALNLDYVMMVNGWRRFVWKEILTGQFQALLYPPSEGLGKDEIVTTRLKPNTVNLSEKAYLVPLNEAYDEKVIKKNTREFGRNTSGGSTIALKGNTAVIDSKNTYSNMIDYMKGRVSGVTVSDNGINIRNSGSIVSGTDPLILQDDLTISFNDLKSIPPNQVARVEVLKGSDATMYGVRGANGVLIIHMRKGGQINTEIKDEPIEASPERILTFL
ncbi:MAG: TonB-dependent receptor plug domain-containing protein [Bacteroidales bacterium]|nr:TonB-dependent receptor plug domain-containing protein [Bacteroidales bacterium]